MSTTARALLANVSTTILAMAGACGTEPGPSSVSDGGVAASVRQLAPPRITTGLVALYELNEASGTVVGDSAGSAAPLDLVVEDPAAVEWRPGALSLIASTRVVSLRPASDIADAVAQTDEISVEAWIRPASLTQDGPARIVTISATPGQRNLTMGQGLWGNRPTDLVDVRLRTTTTSHNGLPSITTPPGSLTTGLHHVVYTRDASGTARIYVDAVQRASGTVAGDLSAWDADFLLALGNELTGDRPWLGDLHLVALYDRALTEADVTQNFDAGPEGDGRPPPDGGVHDAGMPDAGFDAATPDAGFDAATPDAGFDAGPPDAGFDAGPPDAGFDAGPPDAGPPDAGFDAGPPDAGPPDAGFDAATPDAGPPDAGLDAGPPDAGAPGTVFDAGLDAGPPDAGAPGTVFDAGLDAGTPFDASTADASEPGGRVGDGLLVLYELDEGAGSNVLDTSGTGAPLDLVIQDMASVSWLPGALSLTAPARIVSQRAASDEAEAVRVTDEISVEAWIRPASLGQDGPARIVTISESAYARNLTLGQGLWGSHPTDVVDVRLRTTSTSANGTPSTTTPTGTLSLSLQHVVYTRDAGGTARIYVDGTLRTSASVAGDLSNWDPTHLLALGNEVTGDRPWLGELHLVALYGRALTGTEVVQNFEAGPDGTTGGGTVPDAGAPDAGGMDASAPDSGSAGGGLDAGTVDAGVDSAVPDSGTSPPPGPVIVPFTHVIIDPAPPADKHAKTLGDIDGDGLLDVIVAGARGGDGLFWYRYPDWSKHTIVPPGITGFTTDMQVADVDRDGDQDVVVPKGYSKGESVWWYENPRPAGDPATAAWTEHEIGSAPAHDLEVGDIDGDGRVDVVARDGSATIFLQAAADTWTPAIVSTRPTEGTALGDIDGDGDLDIAINSYWLENPLPGGNPGVDAWSEHLIDRDWPDQVGVHVADINGDGRLDVAYAASEGVGRLSWYPGPSNPASGPWVEHVVDPSLDYVHTFESADVDLDGQRDLVTAEMQQSSNPDEVGVYFNRGDGLSWEHQILATTGSHNIRVGDIGGDGDIDVVGANWLGAAPVEMWRNDLDPGWKRHVIDASKPWRSVFVRAGDVDGDGRPDVATGGWWYRNPGSNSGAWERRAFGTPLHNLAVLRDFDGDGDLDALGTQGDATLDNSDFAWAENDGAATFTVHTNVESGVGDFLQGVDVSPLDPGGPLEVLLSWHDSRVGIQGLTVPASPAAETWTWRTVATTSSGEDLTAADLDSDGDTDLMLGTRWLRNDGASAWTSRVVSSTFPPPDRHELADLSGDGRADLVVGEESPGAPGRVAWFERPVDPEAPWIEHPISSTIVGGGMSLDVGDVDRDGDVDVVVGEHATSSSSTATLRLLVLENVDGAGSAWRERLVYEGDEHHDGARLVDIDRDGDLDIVSIGWTHSRVLLYENRTVY